MTYYTWPTQQDFDTWHAIVITGLGLPRIGNNARTGKPEPDKQATTGYTSVTEVAPGDWRAMVDLDHMPRGDDGFVLPKILDLLGTPCDPPPVEELP